MDINATIGLGQLVLGVLVYLGVDIKMIKAIAGQVTWRERIVLFLLSGGLMFSTYAVVSTRHDQPPIAVTTGKQEALAGLNRTPEETVRAWLDKGGYSLKSLPPKPHHIFALAVTAKPGEAFDLFQQKDRSDVLTIETVSIPLTQTLEKLRSLSQKQKMQFFHDLKVELLRFDIESRIDLLTGSIYLHEDIPFDSSTRRAEFMRAVFHLKRATKTVDVFHDKLTQGGYDVAG